MTKTWTLIFTLFLCLAVSEIRAQGWEAGIFFGISHYQGDLQRSHVEILEAHHGNGVFARYSFSNRWALKAHLYQGTVSGSDANYPDEPVRNRNLSFRTPIKEAGLQLELTCLKLGATSKHWQKNKVSYRFSTYVFSGVSGFHFNPKAYYNGNWYDLQPLGTEGQGLPGNPKKYEKFQVAIPLGFGAKFNLTHWSTIGFEMGFRKTFTDYIDDVSSLYPDLNALAEANPMAATLSYRSPEIFPEAGGHDPSGTNRGGVSWNDSYVFAGITASIKLSR